jgi:hypothetical protein
MGAVLNFFKGLPSRLLRIGTAIIDGLIDGIKSGIEKLKGIFSWITDHIPDWKGPASKDKKLLLDNGQYIMQGLTTGIESQIPALERTLGGVTDTIAGTSADMNATIDAGAGGAAVAGGAPVMVFNINVAPGTNAAELGRQLEVQLMARRRQIGTQLGFMY